MSILSDIVGAVKPRNFPWMLLTGAVILCGLGAVFIASAESVSLAYRHLVFAAIGIGAFSVMAPPDYRHLSALAVPLYTLGLASLVMLRFDPDFSAFRQ